MFSGEKKLHFDAQKKEGRNVLHSTFHLPAFNTSHLLALTVPTSLTQLCQEPWLLLLDQIVEYN